VKSTVVIEINNQFLKLIAAKPSLKGPQILRLAVKSVTGLSDEDLAKAIPQLLKELGLSPSPLIVSFPRNLSTVRNLRFPSADPNEISGMIDLHVGRQVPYAKEDIISDYQILGTDEVGYAKVILAIVQREALKRIFNILDQVRLSPEKVELGTYGVWSRVLFSQKNLIRSDELYLLLDIDRDFTDFIIFSKDNLLFSRSITLGQEEMGEEIKRTKFVGEIKQSLVIFQGEETSKKPAKIFLSGAQAGIKEMSEFLNKELNLTVEVITAFQNLSLSKNITKATSAVPEGVSISGVTGLAIDTTREKITFSLPEIQVRSQIKKRTRQLVTLGSLLTYILAVICGLFFGRMYNREAYLRGLRERFEKIKQETDSLAQKSREINIIKGRLDIQSSALKYLYEIHKLVPEEIILNAITFEEADKMVLRGQAKEMSNVFEFITVLEGSAYFQKIESKETRKKKIKGREVSEFEISCPLIR